MKKKDLLIIILLPIILLISCQYEKEEYIINKCDSEISFVDMVQPIINNNCLQCHNGNQFPDLRNYESIVKMQSESKRKLQLRECL